jgi:hypothetical protein
LKVLIKYYKSLRGRFKIVLISCLMIIPAGINAQYVEIKAKLDTDQVTIGDQFNLNLYVNQPAGIEVKFPEIADSLAGKLEVLRQFETDTLRSDDRLELTRKVLLTCFDSGFYQIPPLPFTLSSNNWNDSLFSNPIFLTVNTVPLDSVIRDIKQPIQVPISFAEIYPYILIGLGVAGLVLLIVYLLRKRKRNEPVFSISRPQEPAHIIALRELDALREAKLWQRNEYKQYYTRLTEIIRKYIERRFDIPAMEQTSYDILLAWKNKGYNNQDLYDILRQLLNLADLVKFAKEKPMPTDNETNLDNAYVFVRNTKPVSELQQEKTETEVSITEETVVNE